MKKLKWLGTELILYSLMMSVCFIKPLFAEMVINSFNVNPYSTAGASSTSSNSVTRSQVIASSENGKIDVLGLWFINSGRIDDQSVVVFRVAFNNFLYGSGDADGLQAGELNFMANGIPSVTIKPLFYPSPFKMSGGSTLLYGLSKNMDIKIHIYDMFGHRVFEKDYTAGTPGGLIGENKLTFNASTFGGANLSAGVYFYMLIHEGKVLAKGKVAVIP